MKNRFNYLMAGAMSAGLLAAAGPLWAAGVGTTGGSFLKVGVGARALALGGASVASIGDATALYWNPAGIAGLDMRAVTASYNTLFVDQSQGFLGFAMPIGENGMAAGLGINYLTVSDVEKRAGDTEAADSTFNNANFSLSGTIAKTKVFNEETSFGANIKFIHETLDTKKKNTGAVDLGLFNQYAKNVTLGLTIQNLGPKLGADPLPILVKPGSAIYLLEDKLMLGFDVEAWLQDKRYYGDFGAEYWLAPPMAVRAGYQFGRSQDKLGGATGLGLGLGLRHQGITMDYAFVPFGDLGNTHRITLGARF